MAENLKYNYKAGTAWSYCYKDSVANCDKYGRLYTWAAAMDSAGVFSTNGKGCGFELGCAPKYPVRGVCPEGWHLPDTTEWRVLFNAAGGDTLAKTSLRSTSGWREGKGYGNGTDDFGFTALPGGWGGGEDYQNKEIGGFFWSSNYHDMDNCRHAHYIELTLNNKDELILFDGKYYRFSVRCVKD